MTYLSSHYPSPYEPLQDYPLPPPPPPPQHVAPSSFLFI